MIEKVTAYMKKHHMVNPGDHICIGLSGGADSVCLFLILEQLRRVMDFSMSVVHVEHGIRGEDSLLDMQFARQLAEQYDIPFFCSSFPVEEIAAKEGLTVEEAGRKVRYETFHKEEMRYKAIAKERGGSVKTAVAHHGDDNAETLLFHLCRGSGMDGMAGIRPVRGSIIRPLLCVTRREIEEFLRKEGQGYCIDLTNADMAYSRNRIRNLIMPEISNVNTQAVAHMNRLTEDMAELADYLKNEVKLLLEQNIDYKENKICIDIACLKAYPRVMRQQIMLELLAKAAGSRKDLRREHIEGLLDLAEGRTGRRIDLPYGIMAEKSYDQLLLYHKEERKKDISTDTFVQELIFKDSEQGKIDTAIGKFAYRVFFFNKKYAEIPKNQYTKWFDYDMIKGKLYFRTRQSGDYLVTDAKGHRQKLKSYWINEKVPLAERNHRMLLAEDSHILWIVGGRISEYYKVTESTKTVLEVQWMEEE
ncbi:MAG: tRNA lysidine(34) synthetase TilS [Lachnospiraceae bacterium]|nr:tRNA lysidine(34) synthetase TilS [Lachnospiraceae bacterium]